MLVNLFRLLIGYVKFEFTGGFIEGFLNSCYSMNYNIKNIKTNENGFSAQTDIKTYMQLHKIAYKQGGKVKIIKRKGLPFLLAPLKNRWGVFSGAAFFVLFISFMGGFIWNITVTGNNRVTDARIVDYLAKNGFETGARWSDTDKENLECSVMAEFDDISWISINKMGSLALVEINETVKKPSVIDSSKITNVTASKDGVIMHITALGGWPAVKAGDAVTAGDLLISGINESEVDEKNHFAHAHGTVLAKVNSEIELNISREQKEKIYTYSKEYKSFYFFGLEIPLYLKKDGGEAEISREKSYFLLNSFRLPIGIITEYDNYYEIESKTLSDSELEELAKSELEKRKAEELSDSEILSEDVKLDTGESGCLIKGSYCFIEDIAQEKEILIDEQ